MFLRLGAALGVLIAGCTLPDVRVSEKRTPVGAADGGQRPMTRPPRDDADAGEDDNKPVDGEAVKRADGGSAGSAMKAGGVDAGVRSDAGAAGSGGSSARMPDPQASGTAGVSAGNTEAPAAGSGSESTCEMLLDGEQSDACNRCSCEKCSDLVVSCYGAQDAEEVRLCEALTVCSLEKQCASETCYCGSTPLTTCIFGTGDGPCRAEVEAAAKSTFPGDIVTRSSDPVFPSGRANLLAACRRDSCAAECEITSP